MRIILCMHRSGTFLISDEVQEQIASVWCITFVKLRYLAMQTHSLLLRNKRTGYM